MKKATKWLRVKLAGDPEVEIVLAVGHNATQQHHKKLCPLPTPR